MHPATYLLVYEDDAREVIGLDEMQVLEDPLTERIPAVRALLAGDDAWVAFQAAEILTAWGDGAGMAHFERLVPTWPVAGRDYYPVSVPEQFRDRYPGREMPRFRWMQVAGTPGRDDVGRAPDHRLVISDRVLAVLRAHGMRHALLDDHV